MLYPRFTFLLIVAVTLFQVQISAQTYERYSGTQLSRVKQSFQDIEEIDRLLPNMETKGKRIKNEIEKYPDLPFDSESIIYKAPKQSYVFTPETKDNSWSIFITKNYFIN